MTQPQPLIDLTLLGELEDEAQTEGLSQIITWLRNALTTVNTRLTNLYDSPRESVAQRARHLRHDAQRVIEFVHQVVDRLHRQKAEERTELELCEATVGLINDCYHTAQAAAAMLSDASQKGAAIAPGVEELLDHLAEAARAASDYFQKLGSGEGMRIAELFALAMSEVIETRFWVHRTGTFEYEAGAGEIANALAMLSDWLGTDSPSFAALHSEAVDRKERLFGYLRTLDDLTTWCGDVLEQLSTAVSAASAVAVQALPDEAPQQHPRHIPFPHQLKLAELTDPSPELSPAHEGDTAGLPGLVGQRAELISRLNGRLLDIAKVNKDVLELKYTDEGYRDALTQLAAQCDAVVRELNDPELWELLDGALRAECTAVEREQQTLIECETHWRAARMVAEEMFGALTDPAAVSLHHAFPGLHRRFSAEVDAARAALSRLRLVRTGGLTSLVNGCTQVLQQVADAFTAAGTGDTELALATMRAKNLLSGQISDDRTGLLAVATALSNHHTGTTEQLVHLRSALDAHLRLHAQVLQLAELLSAYARHLRF